MNYVIHLTDKCNMKCKYCYQEKTERELSFENIKKLIDYIVENDKSKNVALSFYGGEPLLKFDVIKDMIDYINSKKKNINFVYSMTTNGTLINDKIIKFLKDNNFVFIQYSIDGMKEAHDKNRILQNGQGTFDAVKSNAEKVLNNVRDVIANKVITKNNLKTLSQDIKYLFDTGFKNIYMLMDYDADWTDEDLPILKEELIKVSNVYADEIMKENNVEISLFDEKIKTYINESHNCNDDCKMGMHTINVGADGNFYPCMQFVGDSKFIIGNCAEGIDIQARLNLLKSAKKEMSVCEECAIRRRCKHTCPCKNYSLTGDINGLSPIVCEFERIIIEVSDQMAEKLYKAGSKMFIQKYYNSDYTIIRYLEEKMTRE